MEIAVVNRYFDSSERKLYFLEFENVCNSTEKCKTELIEHNKKYKNTWASQTDSRWTGMAQFRLGLELIG